MKKVRTRSKRRRFAIINNGQIQTKQFIENLPIHERTDMILTKTITYLED